MERGYLSIFVPSDEA